MRPAEETEILLKSAAERMELSLAAQMPLPYHAGRIAGGFQAVREGGLRQRQADFRPFRRRAGIEFVAETLLVAAGHQASPRRAAIGPGNVAARAADSVFRQGIDVWRGNVLAAVNPDVTVAHVVADDDEDVGLGRGQGAPAREGRRDGEGRAASHEAPDR